MHFTRGVELAGARCGARRPHQLTTMPIVYGRCPCGGTYEARTVEVRMTVAGSPLTFADVPQGFCPVCSSRVYKADMLARLESAMHGRNPGSQHGRPHPPRGAGG